jgi:hypothetical protein
MEALGEMLASWEHAMAEDWLGKWGDAEIPAGGAAS